MNETPGRNRLRSGWALLAVGAAHLLAVVEFSSYLRAEWGSTGIFIALALLAWRKKVSTRLPLSYSAVVLSVFADPSTGVWPAIWLMLVPMLILIRDMPRGWALFGYGQWMGSLIAAGGFAWLWRAMLIFWEVHPLTALVIFFVTIVLFGLQFSLFMVACRFCAAKTKLPLIVLGPLVYVLVEFWLPLPYPMSLALVFSKVPVLTQLSDLIGMTGISLTIALVNGFLFAAWSAWQGKAIRQCLLWSGCAAALIGLQLGYGGYWMHYYRPLPADVTVDIAMIQPMSPLKIDNADHATKERVAENLVRLSREAVSGPLGAPDLLIWPEGASSFSYRTPEFNPEYSERLQAFMKETPVSLVVQDIEFVRMADSSKIRYFSTVTLANPDGSVGGGYRKNILLPFAEYLPGEKTFPFLRKLFHETRSILPGTEKTALRGPQGAFVPLVCYELIFGDFVRLFVKENGHVRYLVNLTNDRWYGPKQQPEQHLGFAVFRAVENRLPLVRSTNSGISALVDARGVISQRTPVMEETILRGKIHLKAGRGLTFYSRHGDVVPRWLLPGLLLLVFIHAYTPKGKRREPPKRRSRRR